MGQGHPRGAQRALPAEASFSPGFVLHRLLNGLAAADVHEQ